jgi:hypothetical protein
MRYSSNLVSFIFAFILVFLNAKAQTNFRKGFVVTSGGETLWGFIKKKEVRNPDRTFAFKNFRDHQQEFSVHNPPISKLSGKSQCVVTYVYEGVPLWVQSYDQCSDTQR